MNIVINLAGKWRFLFGVHELAESVLYFNDCFDRYGRADGT